VWSAGVVAYEVATWELLDENMDTSEAFGFLHKARARLSKARALPRLISSMLQPDWDARISSADAASELARLARRAPSQPRTSDFFKRYATTAPPTPPYTHTDFITNCFDAFHPLTLPLTMYWRTRLEKMPPSHVFLFVGKLHETESPSIASVVQVHPTRFDLEDYRKNELEMLRFVKCTLYQPDLFLIEMLQCSVSPDVMRYANINAYILYNASDITFLPAGADKRGRGRRSADGRSALPSPPGYSDVRTSTYLPAVALESDRGLDRLSISSRTVGSLSAHASRMHLRQSAMLRPARKLQVC
jgi:hypothetical protein